eukprot:jgi/Ulvmu1/4740/UM020_0024.1
MTTRTSVSALARSVGGVIDAKGAIVFRVPDTENTFSAHSSIDGTVFVQTLQDGASPTLHCVAVIDAPHLHDEALTESSGGIATCTQLHWLGTSACVLAIVHGRIAHLVSLSPAINQTQRRHLPYEILGNVVASHSILAMCTDASFTSLFATTSDGALLRFAERASAPPRPTHAARQTWRQVASMGSTGPHCLLAVTSDAHTSDGLLVASASESDACITAWRVPADANKQHSAAPEPELLGVPCASTALQFRPTGAHAGCGGGSEPPPTLLAVGTDGLIRIWLEVDAAAALPPSFVAAAQANGKSVGRSMCLAHVLAPPPLLQLRAPRTLAGWADSGGAAAAAGSHPEPSSWIVATVYDSAPAVEQVEAMSDQVFIWSVTVRAPDVAPRAANGANGGMRANGHARRSARSEEKPADAVVTATCIAPSATAVLWAHEAYRMEWADRGRLAGGGAGGMRLLQAVTCSMREGSPVLVLAHVAVSAARQYAEVRPAVLDLVDVADTAITLPDGSALRAVAVHDVAPQQLAAAHPNMQQLAAHPHMPLAASTGSSGGVAVWGVQPVELVCSVPCGKQPAVAVTWLEHPRTSSPGDGHACMLLVCTRRHLLLYPFHLRSDGSDPVAADLLQDEVAAVPLPQALPEGAACTLHAVVGPDGDRATIVMHAAQDAAPCHAALFSVPLLGAAPLQAQDVHACSAATAQSVVSAEHVSRMHGVRALLAVSADMPPRMSVLAVGDDCLEAIWSNRAAADGSAAGPGGHVLGAHASVACGTAAVLCDFPGLPRKLSLWTVVASGGSVALLPEQVASVADAAGDVHVMAVGLGHAAVAVAGSRGITLWMRCAVGWAPAVRTPVPGAAHTLAATPSGLLAGLPTQLLLFEATVDTPGGCIAIGGTAAAALPPQPLWHPAPLLLLLLQGVHSAVVGLLRQALAHCRGLRQGDAPTALKHVAKGVLPLQTLAAAMLALAGHSFPAQPTRPEHGARAAHALHSAGGAVAGARDRVSLLQRGPTTDSGVLDSAAFSLSARPPIPPSSVNDAAASGQIDMAAFGMSAPAQRPASGAMPSGELDTAHMRAGPPQQQAVQSPLGAPVAAPQPQPPVHSSRPVPGAAGTAGTPVPRVPVASPAVGPGALSDPMSSGQVSLAAFGMAPPQPQQTMQSPMPEASSDPMASGQVDLAAFGMTPPQPQQSTPAPATEDPMASGQVDLAAFGISTARPSPSDAPPTAADPMSSGQVDLAAFGMVHPQPQQSAPAPAPPDPMASGQVDLAAFGMAALSAAGPEPAPSTAGAATQATHITRNPLCSTSGTAPGSRNSQSDAHGGPLGESACVGPTSGPLNRTPSFEMHFPEGLMPSTMASPLNGQPAQTPRLGRPEAVGEAVEAAAPLQASPAAAASALQQMLLLEAHSVATHEQLTEQELKELREAVMPQRGAGKRGAARLIEGPEAHALLRLAELVAASATAATLPAQVQGLDVAGRRAVSAARAGAALLQAQWDAAASEAEALVAEVDGNRSRRRHKMSFSQSALLAKLKGGSSVAGGGLDGSHMSHSAALSSIGGDYGHVEPAAGQEAVEAAATAACAEAWGRMHVLPTMHGMVLHWAFDCASPRALLEAAMGQMPLQEHGKDHDDPEANGMEAFFAVATAAGPQSPWTWRNCRRIGAALWLREAGDVAHAAERIAQATYAAHKDPYEVAVWFCAQGRRKLLGGMLRSKGDVRVADFLGRDFTQQSHRAAAAKNAHKLLSQHRYPLAASFFLLAHDVPAALATCLEHLHDVQLAIMLARVVEAAGTVPPPAGSHGHCADLFAQLIADDAAAECAVLRGLLRRAAGERFTVDHAALDTAGCGCRCMEAHTFPPVAAVGPLARAVGAYSTVQAADWVTRAVLCNMSAPHRSSVPEIAAVPSAQVRQMLGTMVSHASHACEHVGNPTAALALEIRSVAAARCTAHDGPDGAAAPLAQELRNVALARMAGLHAQCMQSFLSAQCMKGAADAATGSAGGLLFADDRRLLAQVLASRPVAATAAAWYVADHQEAVLRDMCGADELQLRRLQEAWLVPAEAELEQSVSRALGLATIVQDQPSAAAAAHRMSVAAQRALEEGAEAQGAGPLRAQASYSICTVGDKDAQAVRCCRGALLPSGSHAQVAVATKKRGLVFCCMRQEQPSMSARSLRYSQLQERVVERWAGTPGPVTAVTGKGMCHPLAHAKHSHRVQMVHPRAESCVAQALASHPQQATLLSGAAPGYLHAWRYTDGTLKATYAPLPFSHHMTDSASTAVPQPAQVVNWSYAMSVAYSDSGSRFAAVGKGGWLALWRHDAQWANTAHGRVGCCDWAHQCVDRRGAAVSFVGARSTLLLAAGTNTDHQDVTLWDVTVPLNSACAGVVHTANHVADAAVSRDGVTALVVDRHGDVCAYDLRKLTASAPVSMGGNGPLVWRAERAHGGGATCVTVCPRQFAAGVEGLQDVEAVATGGRDGSVKLWDISTGVTVQTLHKLHSTVNRGLFGFSSSEERAASKVKSLSFDATGLVSVGHNDSVVVTPWRASADA